MKMTLAQFIWNFNQENREYRMVSTSKMVFWAHEGDSGTILFDGTWRDGTAVANFTVHFTSASLDVWRKTSTNSTFVTMSLKEFESVIAEEEKGQTVWLHFDLLPSFDGGMVHPPDDMGLERDPDNKYPKLEPVPEDSRLYQEALMWTGSTSQFCEEVLHLSMRLSKAFMRESLSPLNVLTLSSEDLIGIRNVGPEGIRLLDAARRNFQ